VSYSDEDSNDSLSVATNPLDWKQRFNSSEQVELIDIEGEYFNILSQLGNTRAYVRAERLFKLINSNKMTWWKPEDR